MTLIIVIVVALIIIAVFAGKIDYTKKINIPNNNTIPNTIKTPDAVTSDATERGIKNILFSADYIPLIIQRTGLQVLETIHIIGSSKAIDTIKGRYDFLNQIIGTLQKAQNNPRYISDIQSSIDVYKSMYYDRVPNGHELALLLKPADFDLNEFYCKSLFAACKRNVEEHLEGIKLLKREDAKIRRREKIKEVIQFTKDELNSNCENASSYLTTISELENLQKSTMPDNIPSPNNVDLEKSSPQAAPILELTSVKPKQSSNANAEFIINPGSTFELTLIGADNVLSKKIHNLLMDESIWGDKKEQQIVALFAEYNLKIKEVEEYKKKYGKIYFETLDKMKEASLEWKEAGELDKEDILEDFRKIAVKEIYEQANCDLVVLFEEEPKDITVDDDLIKQYGFENIQTYLRFADNIEKVRVIPSDNYNRQRFEKLVELNLSIRGSAIPLDQILSILTLKDLNEIANNTEKQFKRKAQAVEFILALPNIEEKIGAKISLRELFKLKPLPSQFESVNLKEISNAWKYTYEVVKLLVETYRNANYALQTLKDKEYVKEYKVESWANEENMCPCAKELINKKYPKSKPPKIPFHVGCNCSLRQEYNFD